MVRTTTLGLMLSLLLIVGGSSNNSIAGSKQKSDSAQTETVQKLIIASGNVALDLDLNQFDDNQASVEKANRATLHMSLTPDSFFTIMVNNDLFRASLPGSVGLIAQDTANLPASLSTALNHLALDRRPTDEAFELVLRDANSGFVFFNIEGQHANYDAANSSFSISEGRLLVSKEFAQQLGQSSLEGHSVGTITLSASMQPIEIKTLVNGEVQSAIMPSIRSHTGDSAPNAAVPGPDVIVGDLPSIQQGGSSGSFVGLGIGTTSCNNGDQPFNWFQLPNTDHPVIPQNLYRMSGGTGNTDTFEQIGQSWLKHAFTALEDNACGFGCNTSGCTTGTHLCVGCSDPYGASLNYSQSGLGSRAWVNPFTGVYPSTAADHTGHTHTGTSHRLTVAVADLNTSLNAGATYFGEGQYVTPHEKVWCAAHPGQCNMYNNVSYRQFSVTGTTSFTFASVGSTVRMQPAIKAWTGATITQFEPDPGNDGIGFVGYKVTNPSAGVWHYEYAVYNENLDRAIQTFSVPLGSGVVLSNIGFHAPSQEPGWANDGTAGNTGFSSTAWPSGVGASTVSWATEKVDANPNANAIRWGTLYNFRFDANQAPSNGNATVGFFKTGSPITVAIQIPGTISAPTPTPTVAPTATPAPTASPTPTPAPTAAPTATPSPAPTATPSPIALTVSLPTASVDVSVNNFTQPVSVSTVSSSSNLIGFQGDFTFNETVVTFQSPPVAGGGLTATGWNVSGNVIPGAGPIRTLRISAFATDGETGLNGSGTLFMLNLTRVGTNGMSTPLTWAASPNNFTFIDSNLTLIPPGTASGGNINITAPTTVSIAGNVDYCSNPALNPVPGVLLTLSGSGSGTALSDGSGNYSFAAVTSGGNYTVTPTKTALIAGSAGINTVDVLGVQRHFLGISILPAGCRLAAADVNGDSAVTTIDVVAVQRFFLGFTSGIANVGKYSFSPLNRTYTAISSNQASQNFDSLVFGDVSSGYVHRDNTSPGTDGAKEVPATVSTVFLPTGAANIPKSNFTVPVGTTTIDGKNKLVGFQADLTFDSSIVSFENNPVQKAGLTSGNWNVSGNVLPGTDRIRTLRISAYSTDFQPLSGEGTLFELNVREANSNKAQANPLVRISEPNPFLFIDADLNVQRPGNASAGDNTLER